MTARVPRTNRLRIWCEDVGRESFLRSLLVGLLGYPPRSLQFHRAPSGQGAASRWVLANAQEVVRQARATRSQRLFGFLVMVMVDEDNEAAERRRHLVEAVQLTGVAERVAVLVPTWNVETWILWRMGKAVDESRSFRPRSHNPAAGELDQAVAQWNAPRQDEAQLVPSLAAARAELARLATFD